MKNSTIAYLQEGDVQLRPLEPEDLETLYQWENDTTLWGYSGATVPYSRYLLKQYLATASSDIYQDKQLRLMVYNSALDTTVGIVDLYDFDPTHSRAGVGILIAPTQQQQGYATRVLRILVRYAFSYLRINQLYAHVSTENEPSNRLFKRAGFLHTATLKEWHKTADGYKDVQLFQLLNRKEK